MEHLIGGFIVVEIALHHIFALHANFAGNVFGVLALDFALHDARQHPTGTVGHKFTPRRVAHQRCTFRHAIAHGERETDFVEKFLHLGIKRRATHDNFFKASAKRLHEFFTDLVVDFIVEIRHSERPAQESLANHRHNHFGIDFFEHQRHQNHQIGFHLTHSLHNHLRRRDSTQQRDVSAASQRRQHIEGAAIGMSQREEREVSRAGVAKPRFNAIHNVAANVVAGNHHPLAKAGGARCVVDVHQSVARHLRIFHIIHGEAIRISGGEFFVECCQGVSHHFTLLLLIEPRFVDRECSAHIAHIVEVKVFPIAFAGEKEFSLAMVHDVLSIVRVKVLQDRHNHGAIGDGGDKHRNPSRVVFADECHVIALLEPDFLVEEVDAGNISRKIGVEKRVFSVVVSQARIVPVLFETLFKNLDSIFF